MPKLKTREFNKYSKVYHTQENKDTVLCPVCNGGQTQTRDDWWNDDGEYEVSYRCLECNCWFHLIYRLHNVEVEKQ